jgi:transcriptional regulator with XRE-family HTH domain
MIALTEPRPQGARPGNRNLGRLIRRYRRLREQTQEDVGKAIGRSREDVSALENAHIKEVPLSVLAKIQQALKIPWEELSAASGMASAEMLANDNQHVQELADEIAEVLPELARLLEERRKIKRLRPDDYDRA